MSHRDQGFHSSSRLPAQDLAQAIDWLLQGATFRTIHLRRDCGWAVRALVMTALFWAWSARTTVRERFDQALETSRRIAGRSVPKRISYQAFMKLLVRWTMPLRGELAWALQSRMQREFPRHFRMAGFLVLAADGSKIELPRTQSHEAAFSPAKTRKRPQKKGSRRSRSQTARQRRARDKKADSPQVALTVLHHVGLRLPWNWRIGPSDSSERDHLRDMLKDLPADTLITADCGFVGYDFWSALLESKHEFVIRVGGNVRLLKQLGTVRESGRTVYLWPDKAAKRHQPPLVLRLVVVQGGRHPWYLVTSVRDSRRLSDRQVAEIYRYRWGIELFFRHFKQTFGRGKLRSHKAEHAECELHWSLLGLWTMLLYAQAQLPMAGDSLPRLSVAQVLRDFGRAFERFADRKDSLRARLRRAVVDRYVRRDKRSRGYPRKKYEPPAKAPQISRATKQQRKLAQQLPPRHTKIRLTA